MEKPLWAPWRIEYILQDKPDFCVLCEKKGRSDKDRLILTQGKYSFVIMNLYPYNNGHLMICPYEHTNDWLSLDSITKQEMQNFLDQSMKVLKKLMKPDGFNIGMNIGKTAGAGIDEHLHWHIVPRWNGDTNFMPVLNHTKVHVDALEETWKKLKSEFSNLSR